MNLLIIIPTYNEKKNLEKLTRRILDLDLPKYQILIIDDNSPDGTGRIAERHAKKFEHIKALHRSKKLGLGSAYVDGFRYALSRNFSHIITLDADFSHDPTDIPRFLAFLDKGEIILGSRYATGGKLLNWPLHRVVFSRVANFIVRIILGIKILDATSGFKCYSRKFIQSLNFSKISARNYLFQVEMLFHARYRNFKVYEVPITFRGRIFGDSKVSIKEVLDCSGTIVKLTGQRLIRRIRKNFVISKKLRFSRRPDQLKNIKSIK